MADTLPINFPFPTENIVASFDFFDVAEGSGVIIFDGFITDESDGGVQTFGYFLDRSPQYTTLAATNYQNFTPTKTFTTGAFNRPLVLKGTAKVNMNLTISGTAGHAAKIKVTIQKNSVDVVSKSTEVYSVGGASVQRPIMQMTVPETLIAIGDVIQVKIEQVNNTGTPTIRIFADPANRTGADGTASPTRLIIGLPFKVQA